MLRYVCVLLCYLNLHFSKCSFVPVIYNRICYFDIKMYLNTFVRPSEETHKVAATLID